MTGSARSPRRDAARLLLLAVAVLVLANLLAPDAAARWAGTQPEGWRRNVAGALTDPLARVSGKLSLGQPLEQVTELLDAGPAPVTFAPAVRNPATIAPTRVPPPTGEAGATGVSTTVDAADPSVVPDDPEAPVATTTSVSVVVPTTATTTSVSVVEPTTSVSVVLPAVRMGSADDPLRVLAVGDSLMLDLQRGMDRTFGRRPDVMVEGRGKLGFGFTVPYWDWENDVLADYAGLIAEIRPDVVVVMIGANEFEGHVLEGESLVPGSLRWVEVLAERADEAMARWRADGAHVYWWTTPRMRDQRFLTDGLNEIWTSVLAAWGSGSWNLDSMEVLGDGSGAYRDRMPDDDGGTVRLRKEHGVHFEEVGADLLARQLEQRLVSDGWLGPVG
jgi:hypothetical protein